MFPKTWEKAPTVFCRIHVVSTKAKQSMTESLSLALISDLLEAWANTCIILTRNKAFYLDCLEITSPSLVRLPSICMLNWFIRDVGRLRRWPNIILTRNKALYLDLLEITSPSLVRLPSICMLNWFIRDVGRLSRSLWRSRRGTAWMVQRSSRINSWFVCLGTVSSVITWKSWPYNDLYWWQ